VRCLPNTLCSLKEFVKCTNQGWLLSAGHSKAPGVRPGRHAISHKNQAFSGCFDRLSWAPASKTHTGAVEAHYEANSIVLVGLNDESSVPACKGGLLSTRLGFLHVSIVAVDVHATLLSHTAPSSSLVSQGLLFQGTRQASQKPGWANAFLCRVCP
jgi:hypothetical protein